MSGSHKISDFVATHTVNRVVYAITYDAIGYPTKWRNAMDIEWYGRQMSLFANNDGSIADYSYNADGIRTGKTLYDAEANLIGNISYTLDGNRIIAENRLGTKIYYTYDDKGAIMGMYYGGQNYIFSKNLQGDVIGIYNESRQLVAKYSYNAYGEIMSITDASGVDVSSNSAHIANINPFRYRGYYYDTETGFYYVSSRYYDPEIGRWISPEPNVYYGEFDETAGLLGYNVYAYCANNPVMFKDETGESITLACVLIGAGFGLLAGGGFGAYRASKKGYSPSDGWKYWKYVVGYGVAGGAVGALVGWGAGALIAKYGVATAATSITKGGGARFSTFKALKNSLGSAGNGRQWHHIVEQCQIKTSRAGFSEYWVHNSNNVINIADDVHQLISNFYSSIPNKQVVNTGGKVFRDWLNGMSFEQQYKWGIWVLRYFGVKV